MMLRSAFDPAFLAQVQRWLDEKGEVFVVIRYAYAAGLKDFLFVTSYGQFESVLKMLRPRADVIVFRERQLPIRGIAGNELLNRALAEIPDGQWWFLLCREGDQLDDFSYDADNSHQAMRSTIEEFSGKHIALGLEPPYGQEDNPDMQSGLIPMPDGTIRAGAY
jgi:hypothetical protein